MDAIRKMALVMFAIPVLSSCEDAADEDAENTDDRQTPAYENMEGDVADCEFDVLTFSIAGGEELEVGVNGLPVAALKGASKVSADAWETVDRRGVRFSDILSKAEITEADDTPVNCVARDGFDPLRTKLSGDTAVLPTFAFLRDNGYVYVGSPGDKDPLYPEMEGKSLIVDYDLAEDSEVPESLGGTIASLSMFRWMMVEKLDDATRGVIEIGPVVK